MKNKKRYEKTKKRIATFVCALVSLATVVSLCAVIFVSCGNGNVQKDSSFVRIKDGGKTISAAIPVEEGTDGDNLYLFAIDLWKDGISSSDKPVAEAKIKGGEARAEIEIDRNLSEMLCKGYQFARKLSEDAYTPITGVYYVTNPYDASESEAKTETSMTKGAIGSVSQLYEVGADATVVTVELGDLMASEYSDECIPYVWNGLTYYAAGEKLEELDKTLRLYTDAGIYVYLELVQTKAFSQLNGGVKNIVFEMLPGKSGYALNMTDPEGASRICGLFDLLAERYGNGGENGKASAFIIGRNVNDMTAWYAGGPSGEQGIRNYIKAVRAAYNILLSHTADGRVYLAVNNGWNIANGNGSTVRDMLSSFNNLAGAEGDFFWQVAIEANASDISDSSIWDDSLASGKSNFVSPANIEVLGNQLSADIYKCDGKERRILLNRFVVGGFDEDARAASYAFAYYKCLSLGGVDSVIYGAMTDGDGTVAGCGLLTEGGLERKKIAEVVLGIDDRLETDLGFVSALVGSKWDYLFKKFANDAIVSCSVNMSGGSQHSNDETCTVTDFSNGDSFGFLPSEGAKFVELRYSEELERPVLYAALDSKTASGRAGILSSTVSSEVIEGVGYFGVVANIISYSNESVVTLRISGYDNAGVEHVYTANTTVPTNEWTTFYCGVEEFTKSVDADTVRVAVFAESADGIYLAELIAEAPDKAEFPTWIIVVLIILAVCGGLTAFVLWFRKNYTFVRE